MEMVKRKLLPRGWMKRNENAESGQALIELALSLSLMLLLMLGAVEFGHVAYAAIEVSNAAAAGSAYGSQASGYAGDTQGIANAAQNDANFSGLTSFTATSFYTCSCSDGTASTCTIGDCPNSHIEVSVTVNTSASFKPLVHVPGLPSTITLRGQSIRKCGQ